MSLIKKPYVLQKVKITWLMLVPLMFVSGCEKVATKTAVSINSNAYFTVFQDATGSAWQTRLGSWRNAQYRPITISFTVPNTSSPYGITFACPSTNGNKPHEVFVFYATPAEMDVIDFNCKKSQDDIVLRSIYGKVEGVNISSSENFIGEQARISLSKDVTLNAWEAYAVTLRSGARDAVGFKGEQKLGQQIDQDVFYIHRNAAFGTSSDPQRVDIDFSGDNIAVFAEPFNPANTSVVNVSGISAGEVVDASVGFLSANQSLLTLAKSDQASFSFVPVPLKLFSGSVSNFLNKDEFNPGEGHELIVETRDIDGKPLRRASKFFTTSNATTHNIVLPQIVPAAPLVGLRNTGEAEEPVVNWSAFSDSAAGVTQLYRWHFNGLAAEPKADQPSNVNVDEVDWTVYVTPGWLKAINGSTQNYSMVIPSEYPVFAMDVDPVTNKNFVAYTWRQEWSLKASSALDWEYTAITVGEKFSAKDVIDYILNRQFNILEEGSKGDYSSKDFVFGETYARAKITP